MVTVTNMTYNIPTSIISELSLGNDQEGDFANFIKHLKEEYPKQIHDSLPFPLNIKLFHAKIEKSSNSGPKLYVFLNHLASDGRSLG